MVNRVLKSGFTLIELSVVIAIVAVMLSSAAVFFGNKTQAEKYRKTRERMEVIAEAIRVFVANNEVLPCPARLNDSLTAATLGAGNTGVTCTDRFANLVATNISMGAVPFQPLGLDAMFMFDAWGNRISYIIDEDLAFTADWVAEGPPNIAVELPVTLTHPTVRFAMLRTPTTAEVGGPDVTSCVDGSSIPVPNYSVQIPVCAAFVLLSHGGNGYMAFNSRGTRITSAMSFSTNTLQQHNTIGAGEDNILFTDQFNLDVNNANYFDDILVYRSKESIKSE